MRGRAHLRLVATALACALVAGACAHHGPSHVNLGLKRIALNLAFKDASKAAPPTIQQVVEAPQLAPQAATVLSAFPEAAPEAPITDLQPIPDVPLFQCATAPDGAKPEILSPATITSPPAVGTYLQHNKGTFSLVAGPFNLSGDYPPFATMDITNVKVTPAAGGGLLVTAPSNTIDFDVVQHGTGSTITTSYHVTDKEVDLTKVVQKIGKAETSFTPTPAVEVYGFNDNDGWVSGGIDQQTGTVMVVQGSRVGDEVVDVCGTVYDAVKVVSTEKIINAETGYNSQTDPNDPRVYWWANQFGGLLLQLHDNSQTVFTADNVPVALTINNTATLSSVDPKPLGKGGF